MARAAQFIEAVGLLTERPNLKVKSQLKMATEDPETCIICYEEKSTLQPTKCCKKQLCLDCKRKCEEQDTQLDRPFRCPHCRHTEEKKQTSLVNANGALTGPSFVSSITFPSFSGLLTYQSGLTVSQTVPVTTASSIGGLTVTGSVPMNHAMPTGLNTTIGTVQLIAPSSSPIILREAKDFTVPNGQYNGERVFIANESGHTVSICSVDHTLMIPMRHDSHVRLYWLHQRWVL